MKHPVESTMAHLHPLHHDLAQASGQDWETWIRLETTPQKHLGSGQKKETIVLEKQHESQKQKTQNPGKPDKKCEASCLDSALCADDSQDF
jgi:hypothetical protein